MPLEFNSKEIDRINTLRMTKKTLLDALSTYVDGDNLAIRRQKDTPKPDNRIPVPLAKSAITDIVGYAGRPGEIRTEYKLAEPLGDKPEIDTDEITELLNQFDLYNNEGIENSELLKRSISFGIAWELWWTSDNLSLGRGILTPEYKIIDNREAWPVYNDNLKPELEAFMRYHGDENKRICDIYYPEKSERWTKTKDVTIWKRETDGDTVYPYKTVPVIPFRTSMNNSPVFEAQLPIIDSYDTLVSKTQNEVDRFNALISLFPDKVDKKFIDAITDAAKPYIDNLGEIDPSAWPRYMEKNLSGVNEFYQAQSDRLERLFHKTIKVPDMSDKEFAGQQSGVAIAYKLIGFEFLVSEIEIYFRLGLMARYDLYADILDISTVGFKKETDLEKYTNEIMWKRNLPVDDTAKVTIAAMLKGLGYDNEAINRFLPNSIIDVDLAPEVADDADGELAALTLDGQTTSEAVDVAKLSGIQITAANDIVSKVAEGILSRAAGINQLMIFLGLTKEQAEQVMGAQSK